MKNLGTTNTYKLLDFFLLVEFAQMIFFPTTYSQYKLICLIPIFIICVRNIFVTHVLVINTGSKLIIAYIFTNLVYIVYGLLRGNPGALAYVPVEIIYPTIYLLLGQVYPKKDDNLKLFIRSVFWLAFIMAIFDTIYLSAINFNISSIINLFSSFDLVMRTGMLGGIINFTSGHTQSYVFCVPFLVMLSLDLDKFVDEKIIPSRTMYYICMALTTAMSLLSSSRALIVCVIVAYIARLVFAVSLKIKPKTLLIGALIFLFVIVFWIMKYNSIKPFIDGVWSSIVTGFSKTSIIDTSSSEYLRAAQKEILISGWMNHPLFGSGTGAVAEGIVRNIEQPWSYELSYYSLLFQKGIIGFIFFGMIIANTVIRLIKIKRYKMFTYPMLAGYIAFIVGNSINPTLEKFSFIWILYLPLLIIDYFERKLNMYYSSEIKTYT